MAIPLTPAQVLAALKSEGVKVTEYREWKTHNRNHKGPWGPVHGVVIHHTVTKGDTEAQTAASVALCYNGHSALPGPLCHAVGAKDGRVYLVGHGRTNHAGSGDRDVLQAVIDETALPPANDTVSDGNKSFYGIELINLGDGKDPWPVAQYEAAVRWAAALCRAHGWSAKSVIGHKEWQPGKVDPRGIDMGQFRADVQTRLNRAPSTSPQQPTPAPAPSTTTGADMPEFTSLAYTGGDLDLVAGQYRTVYWDAEYQDGAGDHGNGGSTIVSGEHFTGMVALTFSAAVPAGVTVRMVHHLDTGGTSDDYTVQLVAGLTHHTFPYTARVAEDRDLRFEIENGSGQLVTVVWAAVRGATWAL